MNDPQPMPTDAERAQFEKMMRRETFDDLSRVSDGSYKSYEARVGWIAWQAARRTPAPVGVEPVAWRVRRLDSPNYWIIFLHKPVDALMDPKREVQPLYTAQALAMGRDTARLDWLGRAGPTSICVVMDRDHDGEVEVSTDDVDGYGNTLREAIDAAMKKGANHD